MGTVITIEYCPNCGTKLEDLPGIGPACLGPMTCPVSDGADRWLTLSEAQRDGAKKERLEECRRYKAQGLPKFKDLDI